MTATYSITAVLIFTSPIIAFVSCFFAASAWQGCKANFIKWGKIKTWITCAVFSTTLGIVLDLSNANLLTWYFYGYLGIFSLAICGRYTAVLKKDEGFANAMYGLLMGITVGIAVAHISESDSRGHKMLNSILMIVGGGIAGNMLHEGLKRLKVENDSPQKDIPDGP